MMEDSEDKNPLGDLFRKVLKGGWPKLVTELGAVGLMLIMFYQGEQRLYETQREAIQILQQELHEARKQSDNQIADMQRKWEANREMLVNHSRDHKEIIEALRIVLASRAGKHNE